MTPSLPTLIAEVRAAPSLSRLRLEAIAGVQLAPQPGTDAFAFYTTETRTSDGASLAFDYREPRPGGGATAGPLLSISIQGVCVSKVEVERRYGPLEITGVPHGHSLDEQLSLSREERWGELSFGFAERRPDCLSTVSFSYAPKAAR